MNARATFLTAMGVLLFAMIAGFYWVGRPLLVNRFARAEMERFRNFVPLIEHALQSELDALDLIAQKYGLGSEVIRLTDSAPQTNLCPVTDALASSKLNLLAILPTHGAPLVAHLFDPQNGRLSSIAVALADACRPNGPLDLSMLSGPKDRLQGLLPLGDDLFLVALRRAPDTQSSTHPRNIVLVGRRLTQDDLRHRLAAMLPANGGDRLSIHRYSGGLLPGSQAGFPASGATGIVSLNDYTISPLPGDDGHRISLRLRDLKGAPAAELALVADAPFTALARNAFWRLLLLALAGGLPALIALWAIAGQTVLKPLNQLSEQEVCAIRRGDETEKHNALPERFNDPISHVRKIENLGVLADGIAHDFNSTLASIIGHAEQIQQELPGNLPHREAIDQIVRAAMRASALTRQMLNAAGQGACDFQPLNLNATLSEMLQLLRASLSRQTHFDVCLAGDLPFVQGDSAQLWQVAMTLLINASDALGGCPGSIRMTTSALTADPAELAEFHGTAGLKPGLYVMLEVADSGCGMPEETRMRIFDPLFSTRATGRGLGLSAVLDIIRAHGGGIRARSQLGQGSSFQVIFPAVPPPNSTAANAANGAGNLEPDPPQTPPDPMRKLALVVDDDPHICRLLAMMARSAGWEVVTANQGCAAVDLFHRYINEIELVFLDEEMPELNGHAVLQVIRNRCPHLHAVIISGHGAAACAQRFADLRPTAILSKPFRRDDLMAILKQVTITKSSKENGPPCS